MGNPIKIFVNLPVEDLQKSKDFFSKLGFTFNERFTDENAACMVIGDDIYTMLLTKGFFKNFTSKGIADTTTVTEVIVSLGVESREKVNEMVERAKAAGGRVTREPLNMKYMVQWGFEDIDGHLWEAIWMDQRAVTGEVPIE